MDAKAVQQDGITTSSEDFEVGNVEIDKARERKLVRKLDLHILPVIMLLYTFSFLDR